MKSVLEFLGLVFVIIAVVFVLTYKHTVKSNDEAIKSKVEIIALAEKSEDPVVLSEAARARIELKEMQEAKERAKIAIQNEEKVKAAKEAEKKRELEEFSKTPEALFLKVGISIFMMAFVVIMLSQVLKGLRIS